MNFDNFIKKKTITIGDTEFEVRSISARQCEEFAQYTKDNAGKALSQSCWLIKHGCPAFAEMEINELLEMPDYMAMELSDAVLEMSGLNEKKQKAAGLDEKGSSTA